MVVEEEEKVFDVKVELIIVSGYHVFRGRGGAQVAVYTSFHRAPQPVAS